MLGLDLIEIDRIESLANKYQERFYERVYTAGELKYCLAQSKETYPELAARFAAKEAVVKALGTGMRGVGWREIEVIRNPLGKPQILLHSRARAIAEQLGVADIQLSLTHTRSTAAAVAILQYHLVAVDEELAETDLVDDEQAEEEDMAWDEKEPELQ